MLWVYDEAIAKDLERSINAGTANSIVKVIDKEGVIPLIAQMKEDQIDFPLLCLMRSQDTPVDRDRTNFTAQQIGMPASYDSEKNEVYLEKSLPIKLDYTLTVLTTNTVDMDEIIRELLFKYYNMYFLTIETPYESKRKIRFGISIEGSITRNSGSFEYISGGKLYEADITLSCDGAVMLYYTPRKVSQFRQTSITVEDKNRNETVTENL